MATSIDPTTLPHDNRGGVLIGVVSTVLSIASLAVALRFYTRGHLLKNQLGADDYLSFVALLFAIATGASQCVNTRHGLGAHVWDLQGPDAVVAYLKNFYVNITLYNTGLFFVKMTFLAQYYRVIVLKRFRTICIIAMVLVGTWSSSQVLVGIFFCNPIAGFWDSSIKATCIPDLPQWYINAAINIASDVLIFIMPLPVLAHLKLPRAQKIPLLGSFSLGFFTCAISVIRIKYLKEGTDFTYENVDASSWSITELSSGVICSCLPTLRPLVAKYVPALASKIQHSSRGYHRQSGSGVTDEVDLKLRTKERAHNKARTDSLDDLYRRDTNGTESGDASDSIIGLKDAKESLCGSKPESPVSMTSAVPVQLPRYSGPMKPDRVWPQPGVSTTISAGASGEQQHPPYHPRYQHASRSQSDMIRVTHDIEQQSLRGTSPRAQV